MCIVVKQVLTYEAHNVQHINNDTPVVATLAKIWVVTSPLNKHTLHCRTKAMHHPAVQVLSTYGTVYPLYTR